MLTEPLPTTLDVRKAAVRGVTVSGCLEASRMERLLPALASQEARVEATLTFFRDEENRSCVTVNLSADVALICQRCLKPMRVSLQGEHQLGIVGDDDQARQLPARLEPLVVEGETCDLWSVVEDELILSLPIVSYHDSGDCKQILDDYQAEPATSDTTGENPFSVLEQLKPGHS